MEKVTAINKGKQVKNLVSDQNKPDVTRIRVEYSDGDSQEVNKGAVVTMIPVNGETQVNVEFKRMNGGEVIQFFEAMLTMSCQVLGINVEEENENNNPECVSNKSGVCEGTDEPCTDCITEYGSNE